MREGERTGEPASHRQRHPHTTEGERERERGAHKAGGTEDWTGKEKEMMISRIIPE